MYELLRPLAIRCCAAAAVLVTGLPLVPAVLAAELPARTFFGITPMSQAGMADASTEHPGLVVDAVAADSTAVSLGIEPGDRINSINGDPVASYEALVEFLSELTVGTALQVSVTRGSESLDLEGALQARPRESSEAFEVIYGAVDVGTVDRPSVVRNITYRPPNATAESPQPAVFHIQGYTCSSIDYAFMPELTLNQIMVTLAEAGYVVVKQEKPGVGDSAGPDCADIDFDTELAAFSAGLEALKAMPFVDADHVHIFGHSLGGVQAPLLARDHAIKSIIAYGATVDSWRDYMLDIYGKQSLIMGVSEEQAAQNRSMIKPLIDAWLTTDRPWQDILADPALQPALSSGLLPVEGERVFGRSYQFFRGLNQFDLVETWREIDSHALAMHGSLDIQAIDSAWTDALVEIVNNPPERIGEAVILENAEHAFLVFESRQDQMTALADGSYSPGQPGDRYDTRAAEAMLTWLNRFSPVQRSQ